MSRALSARSSTFSRLATLYRSQEVAQLIGQKRGESKYHCINRLAWQPEVAATLEQEVLEKGMPVVLCGAMQGWKAQQLSLQDLHDHYGDRQVLVEVSQRGSTYVDGFQPSPRRRFQADVPVPLALLLEHMQSKPSPMLLYLAQKDVQDLLPELAVDPEQLPFRVIKDRLWQQSMWLGPKGTKTPLHRDPYSNLLCQVWGAKQILVCKPEDSSRLYPFTSRVLRNTSQVDLERVDPVKFPDFSAVVFQECMLKAGEMLYLPPKHWHYVRSLENSMSLSFWWT